jgi:hypothetical protein
MQNPAKTIVEKAPRRYRFSRRLNLFLAKSLKVPRLSAIRIARSINIAARPFAHWQRRRAAEAIIGDRRSGLKKVSIDKRDGYAFVSADTLPEIGLAIAEAASVYAAAVKKQALALGDRGRSKKTFMQYAADGEETSLCRDIMKLALARPLIDAVTEYLGEVPIVGNASILVSVPNDSQVGSQLYHLDFADEKQVKLFVYVDAVTKDNGPFTFTPALVTEELVKIYNYDRGRLSIEQVQKAVGPDREIQVTGPAGTALLCDTSRCLHYGSNRNRTTRIVVLIQYVSHAVPEQPPVIWPVEELSRALKLDPIQKMALTV